MKVKIKWGLRKKDSNRVIVYEVWDENLSYVSIKFTKEEKEEIYNTVLKSLNGVLSYKTDIGIYL